MLQKAGCLDLSDAEKEREKILEKAREWFKNYKGQWPKNICEDQAAALYNYLRQEGPWEYWRFDGVSGTRFRMPILPPGYWFPRFRECSNAVGVFPIEDVNPDGEAFVIDGFHGYDNSGTDISVYPSLDAFFEIFWMGKTKSLWGPQPQPGWQRAIQRAFSFDTNIVPMFHP